MISIACRLLAPLLQIVAGIIFKDSDTGPLAIVVRSLTLMSATEQGQKATTSNCDVDEEQRNENRV